MPETQAKKTVASKPPETTQPEKEAAYAEEVVERGPAQMSQPELLGNLVRRTLENPADISKVKRDLIIWYNAQPLENRKQMASDALKVMDKLKLTSESLYQTFVEISMLDRAQLV